MTIKYLDSKRISTSASNAGYWNFDGINDYVQMPTIPTGYTFAVSMWVRKDASGRQAIFIDQSTNGIWLEDAGLGSIKLRVGHSQSGSDFNTNTSIPVDGNFHHLVFNVGTPNQIWLDGVSLGTGGSANTTSTNFVSFMGARDSSGTKDRFLNGALKKVGIWDRKLTSTEVASLYADADPSTISSGLLASYNFAQTGNILEDQTNSYDGTNNGATTTVPETKPTNVQDNSILVEKDTGRRYWFDSGDYKVHTFTTTGNQNFVVTGSGDADILVVAGGGAGGYYGAGGGAGGVLYGTNISLTAGTYVVDVGAGGTPSTSHGSRPTNASGTDSQFGSLTLAKGGGEGGHGATGDPSATTGDNGGSGGGGSHADNGGTSNQTTGSSLTVKFGTSGGNGRTGFSSSDEVSAGGGGAGAVGVQGDTSGNGGAGGAGTSSSISGSAVTYAGGGGGGTNTDHFSGSQVGGVGGSSIGGNGASVSVSGVAGTSNTGSGGGGGNLGGSANNYGGAGGSGIVIVKYRIDSGITATGGTETNTPPDTWTYENTSLVPTVSGLKLHLDASDSTTITKDGSNLVSAWNDKSGQANHVVQATGSKQPLWVDQVQNTLPTIRFDGTDDFLKITAFTGGALAQPNTVFVVCKMPTASTGWRAVYDGETARHVFYTQANNASNPTCNQMYAGAELGNDVADSTNIFLYTQLWNGASSTLRKSKTQIDSGNAGTLSFDGITLGAGNNGTGNVGNPDICEIIVYDSSLSTSDRDSIEDYLTKKWGV